jgi:anti-sigma-K factor RskA
MSERELAAEFVLGELDERRRAEVIRRLEADVDLRAEVEVMRALAGDLGELPADAWLQTEAARPAPRGRRAWSVRPAFALGAVLLALILGGAAGVLLDDGGDSSPPAAQIVLQPLGPDAAARGEVAMPSEGEMVLSVSDLPSTAPGQYYEVWLIDDRERTVPIASFRVGGDGAARLRVPLPVDPARFRFFDVSRQEEAAGTQHSGDSVLRGPTAPS